MDFGVATTGMPAAKASYTLVLQPIPRITGATNTRHVRQFVESKNPTEEYPEKTPWTYLYYQQVGLDYGMKHKRPSAGLIAQRTRPLSHKVRQILELMFCSLQQQFSCTTLGELTKVLRNTTKAIHQGTL